MATYTWKDNVLTVEFVAADATAEQKAKYPPLSFDLGNAPDALKNAAQQFGVGTIVRNATAGKMDDLDVAYAAAKAKIAVLNSGVIVAKGEQKAKVELTDAEKAEVIASVIVEGKRAKGDQREPAAIMAAFRELPDEKQVAVLESIKKSVDKALKARLKLKKDASGGASW